MNNNLGRLDFTGNLEDSSFLDKFVEFYFETGRFPGNTRLIILPRTLPEETKNRKPIKLRILFEIFQMTDLKALVSLQALCALLLNLTDNIEAEDIVHSALSGFFENLTVASLNENNTSRESKFDALKKLSILLYQHFDVVSLKRISKAQNNAFKVKTELNKYKDDIIPVRAEIVDVNEYSPPIPGPLPSNDTIKNGKIEINKETLEITLAKAKQSLKATRDADEEDKQKLISDITDPTPGAVVKDYFDDDNNQFITSTDKPLELNDYDKKNLLIINKN